MATVLLTSADIANGSSADINGNAIPDECEACNTACEPAACSPADGVVWPAPTGGALGTGIASHLVLTPTSTHTTHQTSPAAT